MTTEKQQRCRWCGRGLVPGNAVQDPAPPDPLGLAPVHVECASRIKLRLLDWRDSERTPIGDVARLAEEVVAQVAAGHTITMTPDSDLYARARLLVLRAKGERP